MTARHFARTAGLFLSAGVLSLGTAALGSKTIPKPPPDPAVVAADPQVQTVSKANREFGFRLLTQLSKATPDKNIFFSPFSVSEALTLVLNGVGGKTRTEIASALGLTGRTADQINQANSLLLPSLENPDPAVQLSVANALWANTGFTFDPAFQQTGRAFYQARTDTLNFGSPAAADTINGWVKDNTQGKIDKLVSPADLQGADAALTDAVYFHGQWRQPFDKSYTKDGPFTLTSGQTKTLPLMVQTSIYPYLETPQFQAISLPYGAGRISMVVFLPKPGSDLTAFVKGLTRTEWDAWIGQMQPTEMAILLPRFKTQYTTTLNAALDALGMGSAFGPAADFGPMGLRGGYISTVIHKAVLAVDEEGAVASGATAVIMPRGGTPPLMRVDHPFFLAIRDNTTGTLLFAGVIRDPE